MEQSFSSNALEEVLVQKKRFKSYTNQQPRVITTDKYAATEVAIHEMIYSGTLPVKTTLQKIKYLNNIIEQDHRFIKRKIKLMLGFNSFETAEKTICGIETMHMIKKIRLKKFTLPSLVGSLIKLWGFSLNIWVN